MKKLLDADGLRGKGIEYSYVQRWRLIQAGKFPAPIKLGTGPNSRNAWIEAEIDAWIEQRIAARDGATQAA
jgi:predicted DNA-binding transcriptional regulator AlpA